MRVKLLSPDKGYRSDWLWLPLRKIPNLQGIQNSLTYYTESGPPLQAWCITGDHLVVPREYIPFTKWGDLPFEIVDNTRTSFPEVTGVQTQSVLNGPVQHAGMAALIERGNGILSLHCGAGKTVVALHAWALTESPGLIVVNTEDLELQWRERITQHTNIKEEDIGVIRGPKMNWEHPICVASIQTLVSRIEKDEFPEDARNHFGVVIYDEIQHLGAPKFNTTAHLGKGLRWGLSATPSRRDGLDMLYQYHIGPVLYQHHEQDLIPETWFVQTGVTLKSSDYPKVRDGRGEIHLSKLTTWALEHEGRNDLIFTWISDLLKDGRKILVLSPRVEHLEYMTKMFEGASGIKVGMIHGDIKGEVRHQVLKTCDLIFATQQLAREGLDRKEIDSIVLVAPFTDDANLRQTLGRSQRPMLGKSTPIILVFEDELLRPMHEMCKKMRHLLAVMNYPFNVARLE